MNIALKHRYPRLITNAAGRATAGVAMDKDPTRSLVLRKKYAGDATMRLTKLKGQIRHAIIVDDVFGLRAQRENETALVALPRARTLKAAITSPDARTLKANFEYQYDPASVAGFMDQLKVWESEGILELMPGGGPAGQQPWANTYIQSAYQKGLAQSHAKLAQAGISSPLLSTPTEAFFGPFHSDRVALLYGRNFSQLTGITDAMNQGISEVLSRGAIDGIGPYELARRINGRVDKIGIVRARRVARTETTYVLNTASINEYERAEQILDEEIKVEWWTAQDERVRSSHRHRHGKIYEKSTARDLIGEPNCRCALLPVVFDEDGEIPTELPDERLVPPEPSLPDLNSSVRNRMFNDIKGDLTEAINAGKRLPALNGLYKKKYARGFSNDIDYPGTPKPKKEFTSFYNRALWEVENPSGVYNRSSGLIDIDPKPITVLPESISEFSSRGGANVTDHYIQQRVRGFADNKVYWDRQARRLEAGLSTNEINALHTWEESFEFVEAVQNYQKTGVWVDVHGPSGGRITRNMLDDMLSAAGQGGNYEGQVFRGMKLDSSDVDSLFPDDGVLELDTLWSTSRHPDTALTYAVGKYDDFGEDWIEEVGKTKVILNIKTKTGFDFDPISQIRDEFSQGEILLRPDTQYRILKKEIVSVDGGASYNLGLTDTYDILEITLEEF